MTPAEASEAITASIYAKYATMPRKWPVMEPKPAVKKTHKKNRYNPSFAAGAKRLRDARIAAGYTARGLGATIGISGAQICKWEQAAYPISAKHLSNVATALGVTEQWLKEGK